MPIYEYQCLKCGVHLEVMQKMSEKPLSKCRACGGRLEKQWSPTSFQLKGSGWYATDYAVKKTEAKEEKPAAKEEKTETAKPVTTSNGADKAAKSKPKATSSKTGD